MLGVHRNKANRNEALDLLRGIAVLMVICRHWPLCNLLWHAGWLGVDLFFVLSGFLISGLLFNEYEQYGKIDYTRFFIRRAFKIYPIFYFLIFTTLLVYVMNGISIPLRPFLRDMFFLQNYGGGIYAHAWSLAVEEHFYLIIIMCFSVFGKWKGFPNKRSFKITLWCFLLIPLFIRIINCLTINQNTHYSTQTRIDSLFAGVAICYI